MCMLFIKPKNLTLPKAYFDSLREQNNDGVSCYDLETGEIFKTLDYDEAYRYLNDNHDSHLVVHFRFGTSGKKSIHQLHGWKILNDKYTFFHNGVLNTFKGDVKLGLSDTQQLVKMFNHCSGITIDEVVNYLETYEKTSRFLIIDNETKSVIKPKCAQWANPIKIEGVEVQFSNTYAIDWYLQQDDGHLVKSNKKYNSGFNSYDDENDYTEAESDMINELEYILHSHTLKDLVDFVTVNPEIVALYLKKEHLPF